MPAEEIRWIKAGPLEAVRRACVTVVQGEGRPIAVFWHEDRLRALDNRCPHMGFPLHQGTVKDGILSCPWHHARFDLESGCAFDLWADDVPAFAVEVRGDEVFVSDRPLSPETPERAARRLRDGLAQNIGLVIAKSVIDWLKAGGPPRDLVREGILFSAAHRDGWSPGMTILTAMGNLLPLLPDEERGLALWQGLRHAAQDADDEVPRRERRPLEPSTAPLPALQRWIRHFSLVRHRDGAERTLLTALRGGASPAAAAALLVAAATDRFYGSGGHTLDFINKAFEGLDLVGWEHAEAVLPAVVPSLVTARGGEESNAWRYPIDLVPVLEQAFARLPAAFEAGRGKPWGGEAALAGAILGDEPRGIAAALLEAFAAGARPEQAGRALALSAATRIARFGKSNELSDWITALHTFTYAHALHRLLGRIGEADGDCPELAARGVFHGAMAVYLDRFLNVPPAPLPEETVGLEATEEASPERLRRGFLETLDSPQRIDEAGRIVARAVDLRHPVEPLLATLARAVLREDADFHTYQMLEAALLEYAGWGPSPEGRLILVALARYAAAHAPTRRAQGQTADIALRLSRGESLHA